MTQTAEAERSNADSRARHDETNTSGAHRKPLGLFSKVRRFLIGLYALATLVGFAYTYRYYAQFNIDYLSFATVLDFIFASLANIDSLPPTIGASLLGFTVLLLVFGILVFFVGITVKGFAKQCVLLLFWWAVVPFAKVIHWISSTVLFFWSAGRFTLLATVATLGKTWAALSKYRKKREHPGGAAEDQKPERHAVTFSPLKSKRTATIVEEARRRLKQIPSKAAEDWSHSWQWLVRQAKRERHELPRSRIRILSLIGLSFAVAIAAAVRTGAVDADCILKNERDCTPDVLDVLDVRSYLGNAGADNEGRSKGRMTRVIVPANNLASMQSVPELDCGCVEGGAPQGVGSGCAERKTQYRCPRSHFLVDIRQGLRETTRLPGCLVYIGSVEHAHFLARIQGETQPSLCRQSSPVGVGAPPRTPVAPPGGGDDQPTPPPVDGATTEYTPEHEETAENGDGNGRSGSGNGVLPGDPNSSDGTCTHELLATVGPFAPGRARLDQQSACRFGGSELMDFERLNMEANRRIGDGARVREILLIGRVDSRPIGNRLFGSNFALAQARVEHAYGVIKKEKWAKNAHFVRLPAGPRSPGRPHNDYDRSVEVHICIGEERGTTS